MNQPMQNPLIPDILAVLRRNDACQADGFGVHHLLSALAQHPFFESLNGAPDVILFQKNFLLMNGLYQLQQDLWLEEQLVLLISPLSIQLRLSTDDASASSSAITDKASVRDYYLDWDNFHNTTEQEVQDLLNGFWRGFLNVDQKESALQRLNLHVGATRQQIRQRYQTLAATHHPDKGGDAALFIEIRQAYEILR
jgi:DnaJ-domain-containing protein 1